VRIEKLLLLVICFWTMLLAIAPVLGFNFYFPFVVPDVLDSAQQIERLLILRSASFMTSAYFTLRYFLNRKPLSSVSPILVLSNFMIFFGMISNLQNDVSIFEDPSKSNWVVLLVLVIFSYGLFRIHTKDTKKIFDKDW